MLSKTSDRKENVSAERASDARPYGSVNMLRFCIDITYTFRREQTRVPHLSPVNRLQAPGLYAKNAAAFFVRFLAYSEKWLIHAVFRGHVRYVR